jgi:hypothetical protein
MSSTAEILAEILSRSLAPWATALTSTDRDMYDQVASLGWDLPSIPPSLTALAAQSEQVMSSFAVLQRKRRASAPDSGSNDVDQAAAALLGHLTLYVEQLATLRTSLVSELPPTYIAATHIDEQFTRRMFDDGFSRWVQDTSQAAWAVLSALGILEASEEARDPAIYQPRFVRRRIHWERMPLLLKNPSRFLQQLYGWGSPQIDAQRLFSALIALSHALALEARYSYQHPRLLANLAPGSAPGSTGPGLGLIMPLLSIDPVEVDLTLTTLPPSSPTNPQPLALLLSGSLVNDATFELTTFSSLHVNATVDLTTGIALVVHPTDGISLVTSALGSQAATVSAGRLVARLIYSHAEEEERMQLLSAGRALSLEAKALHVEAGAEVQSGSPADAFIGIGFQGGRFNLSKPDGDGLLSTVMPDAPVTIDFDLGARWSCRNGFTFTGTVGLDFDIQTSVELGPIKVRALRVGIHPADSTIDIELSAAFQLSLGPVALTIERLGLKGRLLFESGNLGPVDLDLSFKPPSGAGVAIDAGGIQGGGFLAHDSLAGRYSGALNLAVYGVSVSAFGVLDTKLPNDVKGYSFMVLISAEFTPIQLGLGFTLNGVGGAIGINRTLSKESLDGAVRSGRLDHILFPRDPAAHTPEILSDLQAYFPPAKARYTFGPLAKIGWAGLVEANLGLILELPHPVRLTLLGTIKAGLPTAEKRFVKLNMAIVGQLDFEKKTFALDASLYDSDVGGFPLSGDMALRLAWGRDANFVMAIGGFNPQFQPPPGFPALRRLTVDISPGGNPRVTCQAYLAITSNTAQVGAQAELTAGGHWNIYGWISFDALFVFSPFSFVVDFSAGVALRQGTRKRASVTVHGTLSGPNPWFVKGKACVSICFVDICVGFDVTLSEKRPEPLPPLPDRLLEVLAPSVNDARNWTAELPAQADRAVALGKGVSALDPLGAAILRQTALPLEEKITRFRSQKLGQGEAATYKIESVKFVVNGTATPVTVSKVKEPFARAQFEEVPDAKKLSLPAFENMVAGARVASDAVHAGAAYDSPLQFATFVVNDPSAAHTIALLHLPNATVIDALAHQSTAAISGLRVSGARKYAPLPSAHKFTLAEEAFTIVSARTLGKVSDSAHPLHQALAEAGDALGAVPRGKAIAILTRHLEDHPEDRGEFQVISEDELPVAA